MTWALAVFARRRHRMSGFMALLGARPAPVDGAMLRERDSGRKPRCGHSHFDLDRAT
jgi:hypothetical protein